MAIVDVPRSPMPNGGDITAERDVYTDKDGKVVGNDDPSRLTKVISVGSKVTRADAEKYGLLKAAETPAANLTNEKDEIENKSLTGKLSGKIEKPRK